MSRPAPFDTAELPLGDLERGAAVRRRRLDAQRARHRRLLMADLGIGVALGLLCLVLTPGLASAALVAIVALAVRGLAAVVGVVRKRSGRRSSGPVDERDGGAPGSSAAVRVEDRPAHSSSARDAWRTP